MEQVQESQCCSRKSVAPWLVFHHGNLQTFFSMWGRKYDIKSMNVIQEDWYWTTPQGWMLIMDPCSHSYSLLNPTTSEKIELPPLNWKLPDNCNCILSSSPTKPDCIVMCADFAHHRLFFCNLKDNKWLRYKYKLNSLGAGEHNFAHIVICNGKFYALTTQERLAVIHCDPKAPLTDILELIEYTRPTAFPHYDYYLIESCGELFMVLRYYAGWCSTRTIHFLILKREENNRIKEWKNVDSIGGSVFFLGMNKFSASWSADGLFLKGDCIYFIQKNDLHIYVYDIKESTIERYLPCPSLDNKMPTPFWMMPPI